MPVIDPTTIQLKLDRITLAHRLSRDLVDVAAQRLRDLTRNGQQLKQADVDLLCAAHTAHADTTKQLLAETITLTIA